MYAGKTGNRLIGIDALLPWTVMHKHYGLVVEDHFGLAGRWFATSGALLGMGAASNLVFDKAIATTTIEAVGCWPNHETLPNCKNGYPLRKYIQAAMYEITSETNNLSRVPVPVAKPFVWDPPDYVGRAVIHATAGACFDAVKENGAKSIAC